MYLTGFADEAALDLDGQIAATKELGWTNIESRAIGGVNIHDLSDEAFDEAASWRRPASVSTASVRPSPTGASALIRRRTSPRTWSRSSAPFRA